MRTGCWLAGGWSEDDDVQEKMKPQPSPHHRTNKMKQKKMQSKNGDGMYHQPQYDVYFRFVPGILFKLPVPGTQSAKSPPSVKVCARI